MTHLLHCVPPRLISAIQRVKKGKKIGDARFLSAQFGILSSLAGFHPRSQIAANQQTQKDRGSGENGGDDDLCDYFLS